MKKLFVVLAMLVAMCVNAQWVQTSGPGGGTVYCFTVSGTNIFAGTDGGGVYRSTNNGSSWTSINYGLTNLTVFALASSGTNIFAGTLYGGVFCSTNNGANWAATGLTNIFVN